MKRRSIKAAPCLVVFGKGLERLVHKVACRGANRFESIAHRLISARLIRQVQPDHHHLPRFIENNMRCFRIVFNIELHRRANIARVAGAAHENHLLDALNDLGLEPSGESHIGERPRGHQRDRFFGLPHDNVDDELSRRPRIRIALGLCYRNPQSSFAVNL